MREVGRPSADEPARGFHGGSRDEGAARFRLDRGIALRLPPAIDRRGFARACLLLSLGLTLCGGCAAYRFGTGTLYRPDVRTIHVPMFQSDSFRRYWSELLTEAVVKQIELKTPFKVVHRPDADSTLVGRIVDIRKEVLAEDAFDLPRDIELDLIVQVEWRDRTGRYIVGPAGIPIPRSAFSVAQSNNFVPEAGQTLATAELEAIEKLAEEIVSQMEMPW